MAAQRRRKQKPAVVAEPVEIPDADHEVVIERAAAIDVAKATGTACVRLPGKSGWRFSGCGRCRHAPASSASWPAAHRARSREGHRGVHLGLLADLVLPYGGGGAGCAAGQRARRQERAGPAENKLDAVWLAKLTEKGLLRPSFVPPAPIRQLRDYTRLRLDLTRDRSRYWQRLEKLLEDALIKVSSVASTLDTLSTRDMIEALIAGERDPRRLDISGS